MELLLRSQNLESDENGHAVWPIEEIRESWSPEKTALLLCDVWNSHWCRGAVERLDAMVDRMNDVTKAVRDGGGLIVHAPSNTIDFYADTQARKRVVDTAPSSPPAPADREDPPLPIDDSDGGSDTGGEDSHKAWTQQHPSIDIDDNRDVISDNGEEIYSVYADRGIERMLIMGVHTNMCVLHRTFGIKAMVKWGVRVALIRDLTDTMYNPARSPYVAHDEGTRLVVSFIEKFWCPTIDSAQILG
jgi:nicotinamidase-related amidase